jgi:ribosomal protein S17E
MLAIWPRILKRKKRNMFESYEFRMIFDFKHNKMGTCRILHKVKLSSLTLLNDFFNYRAHTESNEKGFLEPSCRHYLSSHLERLRKTTENLNTDSRYANLVPLKCMLSCSCYTGMWCFIFLRIGLQYL